MPTYSFVIPVHNEEAVLGHLFDGLDHLAERLDGSAEFVMVDDGSTDASWSMLEARAADDARYRAVQLSRNFGHQIAVTAGLDRASGEAVVIMDADLQDPPEVVLEMATRWRDGFDVVYGLRTDREHDTRFKRLTAGWFYKLLNGVSSVDIPAQVGDFRLIDRSVVEAIRCMPERNRYVRGMFAWLGFRQIGVEYRRPARRAGSTSYTLKKMLRLAGDGVIGYSKTPLRVPTAIGAVVTGTCVVVGVVGGVAAVATGRNIRRFLPGIGAGLLGGVQLVSVGIVGEYVSRIFDESIQRPLYVVRAARGAVPSERTGDRFSDQTTTSRTARDGELHSLFERRETQRSTNTRMENPAS